MKAFIGANIVFPDRIIRNSVLLADERIIGICAADEIPETAERIDVSGCLLVPGLVDVHIHGYAGSDVSDGDPQGLRRIAGSIIANGVTSWLPTTMTVPREQLDKALRSIEAVRDEQREGRTGGAQIIGAHAEGPFINPQKRGAQAESNILEPDIRFLDSYAGILTMITMAPEMPGGMEFIRRASETVTVSAGHSTADYETAMRAIRSGVTHATHLFNAMPPLLHRGPGLAGAVLESDLYAEVIADTLHVHPCMLTLTARLKGDRLVLITDCTRAGGCPEGRYELGGQVFTVRGIECRLDDGTIAGSVLRLNQAVANMVRVAGVPIPDAVNMASRNAARSIGLKGKGTLEPGMDADIVVMSGEFEVRETYIRGRKVYTAAEN